MINESTLKEPDALTTLRAQLGHLHAEAGKPSTRTIARDAPQPISHTTVSAVLRCARKPPHWRTLAAVVRALGGDADTLKPLWLQAQQDMRPRPDASNTGYDLVGEPSALGGTPPSGRRHAEPGRTVPRVGRLAGRRVDAATAGTTVLRVLIGTQLQVLRESRGIAPDIADWELSTSDVTVRDIEQGRVGFTKRDVADLLSLYGVRDPEEQAAVFALARRAHRSNWWHRFDDVLPHRFPTYAALEAEASEVEVYELQQVPDVLQTRGYASAAIHLHPFAGRSDVEEQLDRRMERRRLLHGPRAPLYRVVLEDAVLRRPVCGEAVMRAQITALVEAAESPKVRIQIVPEDATTAPAQPRGFTVLHFPDPWLPAVVHMRQLTGSLYIDDPREVRIYGEAMSTLAAEAESPARTVRLLKELVKLPWPWPSVSQLGGTRGPADEQKSADVQRPLKLVS